MTWVVYAVNRNATNRAAPGLLWRDGTSPSRSSAWVRLRGERQMIPSGHGHGWKMDLWMYDGGELEISAASCESQVNKQTNKQTKNLSVRFWQEITLNVRFWSGKRTFRATVRKQRRRSLKKTFQNDRQGTLAETDRCFSYTSAGIISSGLFCSKRHPCNRLR